MKASDIKFEIGNYWVLQKDQSFEVYKIGLTHSVRCAVIGWGGAVGLEKAIAEAKRREIKDGCD